MKNVLSTLLVASAVLLFLGLGANTIWDANEAFYVDTPRHMVETGDYVNPEFNGAPRLNKPVLSYWIVAGFYQLFGVSVAVERVAIAIGALGIVLAAFVFGRALHSPTVGLWAALIVLTAPRFVMFARRIFIDIWVTMFMTLALAAFVMALRRATRARPFAPQWLALMYVAIGCGVLTKGPVALVFPAATIGAWLLIERRLHDIRHLWLVSGALIVTAIVAPWWVALYAQHGWGPIEAFWVGENLGRYTDPMQPGERDIFFYVPVVLGDLFPWTIAVMAGLVAAGVACWQRARNGVSREATTASIATLLCLWVGWHVGVFSLSETKQDLYVFPVVPALAALAAWRLHAAWETRAAWWRAGLLVTSGLLLLVGTGAVLLFGSLARVHQIAGADVLGGVLVGGGLVVGALAARWLIRPATLTLAAMMVLANYTFALVSLPAVEAFKPVLPMVKVIEARTTPGGPVPVVAHYRTVLPSMAFYLGRPIVDVFDMPTLLARAREAKALYVLLRPDEFAEFQMRATAEGLPTCRVSAHTLFEAKLRLVLEGKPWPQVYLAGANAACR
jgi:4-amino-4-deoxy-L-arabinose transferase-like glycosyltransferase